MPQRDHLADLFWEVSRWITPQERVIMPVSMNQIEPVRPQAACHLLCLCLGNLRKEIVKLDTNLMNRDVLRKAAFQNLVLETLNIDFQQVDVIVPMQLHLLRKGGAGRRLSLPPAFNQVLEAVPPPIEKFAMVDAAKPSGLNRRCSVFAMAIVLAATGEGSNM